MISDGICDGLLVQGSVVWAVIVGLSMLIIVGEVGEVGGDEVRCAGG